MNVYDRATFRRALFAIGALLALAAAVVVTTDEATSTASMRLARLAALSPVVGAASLLGIAGHARAGGEVAALEALGATPWRALRGAEWAGLVLGAVAVAVLSTRWSDATSLLPAVQPVLDFVVDGRGARAAGAGLFIEPGGAIHLAALHAPGTSAARSPWSVVPCIAPVALLMPPWAVTPMPLLRRAASGGATFVLVVTALHLVAAARLPAVAASAAALPVLIALTASRRGRVAPS
jgi:hypothetical protein